jgi:hypothetical protein
MFPMPTRVLVRIYQQGKTLGRLSTCIFKAVQRLDVDDWIVQGQDQQLYSTPEQTESDAEAAVLVRSMNHIFSCAKRIEYWSDGNPYPSAEYIVQRFPPCLCGYFPPRVDWDTRADDRTTLVEFGYRPARTLREWKAILPEHGSPCNTYFLNEIPWYNPGYRWDKAPDGDLELW